MILSKPRSITFVESDAATDPIEITSIEFPRSCAHPVPNLWIGPGTIDGEIPAGMVLQRETGELCVIGDVLPVDRVAVARPPPEPPLAPTYHPLMSDTVAIREKRERLWNIMNDCPACDPWDVYDVPEEQLDRDIALHRSPHA